MSHSEKLEDLPEGCSEHFTKVPKVGDYVCVRCSKIYALQAGEKNLYALLKSGMVKG